MTEKLEQIETRIAYLEQANAQLSDEIYRQQQDLDKLRQQLSDVTARFATSQSQTTTYTAEEEKPPHY
jgi:uncharacterized coiled-coil protein SlyX